MKFPKFKKIIIELNRRFNKLGLELFGSYSPFLKSNHYNNYVLRGKNLLCTSGGVTNDEMFVIYEFMQTLKPKNVLIIGNGYGISTLFVSLALIKSKVIVLEKYRTEGIKLTKKLLNGISNKKVIQGSTPEDLEEVSKKYFNNKIDMIIVDAVHTNQIQTKEFLIYEKFLSKNSIVIFHDIISCNLFKSFNFLKKNYKNYHFKVLNKTSNGLAVCLTKKSYNKVKDFLNFYYTDQIDTINFIKFLNNKKRNHLPLKNKFYTQKHPQL